MLLFGELVLSIEDKSFIRGTQTTAVCLSRGAKFILFLVTIAYFKPCFALSSISLVYGLEAPQTR